MRNTVKYTLHILILLCVTSPCQAAWDLNLSEKPLPYPAPEGLFVSQGKVVPIEKYRGHKVMLWLFSTWCHTCVVAAKSLEKNNAELQKSGLVILALRNHKNGGNPGLSIEQFIEKFAASMTQAENWILGEATAQLDNSYNAHHYADVYFLIDEQGMVQVVSTSPAATLSSIQRFVKGQ
jgi:thiol-disulfide isomerase/thioredoxin